MKTINQPKKSKFQESLYEAQKATKENIVSLETAREAFRLGFDEHTEWGYDWDNGEEHPTQSFIGSSYKNNFWRGYDPIGRNIAAPTKQQYLNWLIKMKQITEDKSNELEKAKIEIAELKKQIKELQKSLNNAVNEVVALSTSIDDEL